MHQTFSLCWACWYRNEGVEVRKRRRRRGEGGRALGELPSLLNPAEGLHLEGLSVGAPLPVVFVIAAMVVTLHDVLITTVAGVLVTNPAKCSEETYDKCKLRSLV